MLKLIIIITALLPTAVIARTIVSLCYDFIFGRFFSFYCNQVSFFGRTFYRRKKSEKWKYRRDKDSLIIQHNMSIDLESRIPDNMDRRDFLLSFTKQLFNMAVCAGLIFLGIKLGMIDRIKNYSGNYLMAFLDWFIIGYVLQSIGSLVIFLRVYFVMMKRLAGFTSRALNKLRQGYPFESMDLKPLRELPYPAASPVEKAMYSQIYLCYLASNGKEDEMPEYIQYLEQQVYNKDFIIQNTGMYYWLVFYYSRYWLDPQKATYYFDKVSTILMSDPDANGKRIRAYYAFGIEQDFPKARKLLTEAQQVVADFSIGAERELERQFLRELDDFLNKQGA